jgi:hypothetical protein
VENKNVIKNVIINKPKQKEIFSQAELLGELRRQFFLFVKSKKRATFSFFQSIINLLWSVVEERVKRGKNYFDNTRKVE